ncbi:hypothetical protein L2D08_19440 [Domibacillus sp. PGB-M46]|uniref:hypothetical protein n=1 Tax=Domibacillus sp. PGB-M46 TaxID=2910255 RepID=UPI001F57A186|nr:hypothetical protein [Domibacillus sp. PGB-M46]MCI2256516.1 hypothetical protein [Domibacillus sp. PGB-M46]
MSEKQIEFKTYIEQLEEFRESGHIYPHIMAVSTLLSEKNIITEEEFYSEMIKLIKEKREIVAYR